MRHAAILADGAGDGLHAQFLEANIDSISLYVRADMTKDTHIMLINVMSQLARVSSQLHEELHHSHFFYLLMDNTHFVGLSEYVGPLGLALSSLIALWLQLFPSLSSSSMYVALRCIITDIGLVVVLMGAMVVVDSNLSAEEWKVILCALAGLLTLRGLFTRGLSPQEHATYNALAVLLLLILCFIVAGHHVVLAFPLLMTVVPLSWAIFGRRSGDGDRGTVLAYGLLALIFSPLCLLASFNHAIELWIQSWRVAGSENLPVMVLFSTIFMSGCLRFCAVKRFNYHSA